MSNPITDQEIARLEELPVCPPTCDNLQCRLLARIRSDAETISKLRDERDHYQEAFLNKQKLLERHLNDPANYAAGVSVVAKLRKVAEAARAVLSPGWRPLNCLEGCGCPDSILLRALSHLDLKDNQDNTLLTSNVPIDRVPEERKRPEPTLVPSGGSQQSR